MDLENTKIGPAYSAPDSYFKDTESRLFQRLGIGASSIPTKDVEQIDGNIDVSNPVPKVIDTTGVQKRARKQDPQTAKSEGINKELDSLGNVVIPPLTFSTNENPEWVNFGAIDEEISQVDGQIKVISYGDLLDSNQSNEIHNVSPTELPHKELATESNSTTENVVSDTNAITEIGISEVQSETTTEQPVVESINVESIVVHEVPQSVGLDELESYIKSKNQVPQTQAEPLNSTDEENRAEVVNNNPEEEKWIKPIEEKTISLDAPATAFAPIAGRQHESTAPGWLGIAAAISAIVAAYFIWTAIQPPKFETEEVTLQQEELTMPDSPLDEQIASDTIPDGLQLVEPLILEEMPKYKEPNVYSIIDAEEMPERTKKALQDLEDHGLATFDMEDELFEELDFESL